MACEAKESTPNPVMANRSHRPHCARRATATRVAAVIKRLKKESANIPKREVAAIGRSRAKAPHNAVADPIRKEVHAMRKAHRTCVGIDAGLGALPLAHSNGEVEGRTTPPDWSRGPNMPPSARGDTTARHGPCQRLLEVECTTPAEQSTAAPDPDRRPTPLRIGGP